MGLCLVLEGKETEEKSLPLYPMAQLGCGVHCVFLFHSRLCFCRKSGELSASCSGGGRGQQARQDLESTGRSHQSGPGFWRYAR